MAPLAPTILVLSQASRPFTESTPFLNLMFISTYNNNHPMANFPDACSSHKVNRPDGIGPGPRWHWPRWTFSRTFSKILNTLINDNRSIKFLGARTSPSIVPSNASLYRLHLDQSRIFAATLTTTQRNH
ncbi:unnamed protein product [Nesidiocoris tenuis]|uniref:Uncharacterized protein n=1 Tax=Nesidiocoris tenuis TaxID=355587 RepID=A0A6H5HCZ7_9HEMI|nr:unnamed protein product [Nesidiocoris tenuis]CAB0015634.1 unnamed protein product [Nesidiocoris tenuis]